MNSMSIGQGGNVTPYTETTEKGTEESKDIDLWMGILIQEVLVSRKLASELYERLYSVLSVQDVPQEGIPEQDRQALTPLGQALKDESQSLESGNALMKEILRKLEL